MILDLQTAGIILAGYLALKFIEEGIKYLFKKVRKAIDNEDHFVTEKACTEARGSCKVGLEKDDAKFNEFKKEMREGMSVLKGMLLVIASGGKLTPDDLKDLFK